MLAFKVPPHMRICKSVVVPVCTQVIIFGTHTFISLGHHVSCDKVFSLATALHDISLQHFNRCIAVVTHDVLFRPFRRLRQLWLILRL